MPGLTEVEKVDCDLRACHKMRERALDQLVEAFIQILSIDSRIDVLLGRRADAEAQQ